MSAQFIAEASEVVNELAISPVGIGVITFSILTAAFFVTYAFRSVGTRH